jgi:hypothetical protein
MREEKICASCDQLRYLVDGENVCPGCHQGVASRAQYKVKSKIRQKALDAYGCTCQCCGEKGAKFLEFDHVYNDGAEHRRSMKALGITLYEWLKRENYPSTIQLLCTNCNVAKQRFGICPHQEEKIAARIKALHGGRKPKSYGQWMGERFKTCPSCQQTFMGLAEISVNFYKNSYRGDGWQVYCKRCTGIRNGQKIEEEIDAQRHQQEV